MSEVWARQQEADRIAHGPKWEAGAVLTTTTATTQVRTIHFMRHAEATHNAAFHVQGRAAYKDPQYHDARLTEFGLAQCAAAQTKYNIATHLVPDIELVLVSPCTRATQTALECFGGVLTDKKDAVPFIALECLREKAGQHPCDNRRAVSVLRHAFPAIDYSQMDEDADVYGEMTLGVEHRETNAMITQRTHDFFDWLHTRNETNIVVVTHSAFLSCLFNHVVQCTSDVSNWFENCELRTTHFTITKNEASKETVPE